MIEGVVIGLLVSILIIVILILIRKGGELATLEYNVKLKKLKLSEKVLDDQLKSTPGLMEMIQHNQAVEQAEQEEREKEKENKTVVRGYK